MINEIHDFNVLSIILSKSKTCDVYCRSALYFAFTGRGTVWTVECDDNPLILVQHPNISGTLLVFFPFAYDSVNFIKQIGDLYNYSSFLKKFKEIHLARIPESISLIIPKKEYIHYKLEIINEVVLDWAYPSYDVCLKNLTNPETSKLRDYRNKIRNINNKNIEIVGLKDLGQQKLRDIITQISTDWAQTKLNNNSIEPYQALVQLIDNNTLKINGIILKEKDGYVAFSLWETSKRGTIVPNIATLTRSRRSGLSEYLYYCTAQKLIEQGHDRMCIGGSETAGLDKYKQKFDPINKHKLQTIKMTMLR